jgi:hypothetical protein
MSAGKGDTRRPMEIPQKEFDSKWDKIFKPKTKQKEKKPK